MHHTCCCRDEARETGCAKPDPNNNSDRDRANREADLQLESRLRNGEPSQCWPKLPAPRKSFDVTDGMNLAMGIGTAFDLKRRLQLTF